MSAAAPDVARASDTGDEAAKPAERPARTIVLVGLMGAGKTNIGRRLAQRLGLPFVDADAEIEAAAGETIEDIFRNHGETVFRDGERRVIARLLDNPPHVLATGGGAFMDPQTRQRVRERATSIWLRADLDLLLARVARRSNRPLLKTGDPRAVLAALMEKRHPVYAEADITVDSVDGPPDLTLDLVLEALRRHDASVATTPECNPDAAPRRVPVALGGRGYDVVVGPGLLADAGTHIKPIAGQRPLVVVTDTTVAGLHLAALQDSLAQAGLAYHTIVLPAGEQTKDIGHFGALSEQILALGIERGTQLVALGGGVVGDLTGFTAACLLRGIDFIQIPTTLLAQVDSSVGGKTGINTRAGKNLIGAFHQPRLVLADTGVLSTLPARELRAGYAEVVKYGLIRDRAFFETLERDGAALLAGDDRIRRDAIVHSCAMKAAIVAADERETGDRALLNLGHTFGHALEAETGFGASLLHGEAVAIGMVMAFDFATRRGLCVGQDAGRVRAHLAALGLPTGLRDIARPPDAPPWSADRLVAHMAKDKKVRDGRLTFILPRAIGDAMICRDVDTAEITRFMSELVEANA